MRGYWLLVVLLVAGAVGGQEEGPVVIGGVSYERVDPGEPFTEAPRPTQDWDPPQPSAAEAAAGFLVYVAPDPGEYRTYRRPRPAERVDRLSAFLTPGEDEPVCFGLYALAPLAGLTLTVEPRDAPVTVDVRQMHCWPQRTGWRSRQWYLTPELLLPCADGRKTVPLSRGVLGEVPFDLAEGETQGFWLTLTAPADARPGRYRAVVTLAAAGRPGLRLPLDLEILPFRLLRPQDRYWLLYGDSSRWRTMDDSQILAELKDYRRHGMDGLIEGPMGTPDVSRIREGIVTFDAGPYRKITELCRQAGMNGPHVIGSAGPDLVRRALGIEADLSKGEWPPEVSAGVRAIAKAALEATRGLPKWYYYGVDEPTGENTYAIQDYQAWHDAGAPTYATFYVPSFLEKASAYLTAPCFVVGLVSNEQRAREAREACAKTGAEFWWYGTGSYVNPFPQEGFMFHNRYGAGLLFWKTGAKAEATWTFCRPHEDVFNDFDGSRANSAEPKEQATAYPHLLRPDDWTTYQGAIPTIAWESLREGVDDYLYLYTLQTLIARAKASRNPIVRAAGRDAETALNGLVASVPWVNPMGPVGFETSRLQQVRHAVAEQIRTLQTLLAGRPAAATTKPREFTLHVRVAEAPRRAPLPLVNIPTVSAAPHIDGRLDDACWRAAATVGEFTDIRTGEPAEVGTTCRVAADDRALYVAFECVEPRPDDIVVRETSRDGQVWLEDSVELFVAPGARRPYAHVIVTTANVLLDEANQDPQAWDPEIETAVGKGPDGWSVELALPWAELARAGVPREPVMTLNFGRNRYTGGGIHTAWSCTYDGFHTPARFGLALLPEGPITVTALSLPDLWGHQAVALTVKNLEAAPARALVRLGEGRGRTLDLAPEGAEALVFPTNLRRPGTHELVLAWGPADGPTTRASLAIQTPEPLTLGPVTGLVEPGGVLELPVTLGLAPPEQVRHDLIVRVVGADGPREIRLPAVAGRETRTPVRAAGVATVQARLVGPDRRAVWQGPKLSCAVLSQWPG